MVVAIEGPLAPWAPGLAEELTRLGYSALTTGRHMKLAGMFSRWLAQRDIAVADLTEETVEDFLGGMRAKGGSFQPTGRTLAWLVGYLRVIGVTAEPTVTAPPSELEELLDRYQRYLTVERGLARGTVECYARTARLFLEEYAERGPQTLTEADVTVFMTERCRGRGVSSAKLLATGLRSFLVFAHLEGLVARPLAGAVLSAVGWSGAALPRGLTPREAACLLASCDRRRATGRRDYAVLLLLVRLGLRAGEVSALGLDDLDWRAGEIVVRGKGSREERLPLPTDVGEAIVAYLRDGRPQRPEREVFLRVHAPLCGLSPDAVGELVRDAGERAGLGSFGPHRLRHTAATGMLRAGASLSEVAQVLRHRSVSTTAIYAKVDHLALCQVAMPWPRCGR